jgi:hypothetical protein
LRRSITLAADALAAPSIHPPSHQGAAIDHCDRSGGGSGSGGRIGWSARTALNLLASLNLAIRLVFQGTTPPCGSVGASILGWSGIDFQESFEFGIAAGAENLRLPLKAGAGVVARCLL